MEVALIKVQSHAVSALVLWNSMQGRCLSAEHEYCTLLRSVLRVHSTHLLCKVAGFQGVGPPVPLQLSSWVWSTQLVLSESLKTIVFRVFCRWVLL